MNIFPVCYFPNIKTLELQLNNLLLVSISTIRTLTLMEKLDKPLTKDYSPLVMWASDLEDLYDVLRNCSNIELVVDDMKFESVDEFVKVRKGRNPSVVKITASDPYITIELFNRWARLYVSSSQLLASGLFLKIDLILSRCERKPKFFYQYAWALGSTWVLPNIFYLPPLKPFNYLYFWTVGLTFSWLVFVAFIHLYRFSIIRPMHQEERPSFFQRNIDAIVIAVISALLGAVGGAATTKMADKVWPSPYPAVERDASQSLGQ